MPKDARLPLQIAAALLSKMGSPTTPARAGMWYRCLDATATVLADGEPPNLIKQARSFLEKRTKKTFVLFRGGRTGAGLFLRKSTNMLPGREMIDRSAAARGRAEALPAWAPQALREAMVARPAMSESCFAAAAVRKPWMAGTSPAMTGLG